MASQTLYVPAISCQHCVRRVTQALSEVPGVLAVQVDVASKQVQVTYEGADTPGRVREALNEIGYSPVE